MFQHRKITHLEFFSCKCGLDIFFKNVVSENCSHLSESRAGQNTGFVSAEKPRPKSHYTEEKGKENRKKAKTKEGEKHNSPCLGFFVFCCCFCFVFFAFFIAYTLETVFTTVAQQWFALFWWKSQTGIPKIRPLKISSNLTKLRPNEEIILVWKARQDRKYRVMRREKGKERKRKTKNQCCTLCFYIVCFEDSVSTKKSAWPKKFSWECMRNLNYLQASPLSFERLLKVFVAHSVYDK